MPLGRSDLYVYRFGSISSPTTTTFRRQPRLMKTLFKNLFCLDFSLAFAGHYSKIPSKDCDGDGKRREKTSTKGRNRSGAPAKDSMVRKSDKGFNSDFGVPFTIMRSE